MAPARPSSVLPAEVVFAQRLASNEPKIRRLALKQLKKYITSRSSRGGFSYEDLLKLWKGLHYCMWMQDKPLLQEELANNICGLIPVFGSRDSAIMYLKTYIDTECREWPGIDKWRLDKFMMLIRRMLHQSLQLLKANEWDSGLTSRILELLSEKVVKDSVAPEGIRYHLADIYLDELCKVGGSKLSSDQVLVLLEPWIQALVHTRNKALLNHVIKRIFGQLIMESSVGKEDGGNSSEGMNECSASTDVQISSLKIDYGVLSRRLFSEASSKHCVGRNRTPLYDLVKKFQMLSEGKFPYEEHITSSSEDELSESDLTAAMRRLGKFENAISQGYGKHLKAQEKCVKQKRKLASSSTDTLVKGDLYDGEPDFEACSSNSEQQLPSKKSKRKHTKVISTKTADDDDGSCTASTVSGSTSSLALSSQDSAACQDTTFEANGDPLMPANKPAAGEDAEEMSALMSDQTVCATIGAPKTGLKKPKRKGARASKAADAEGECGDIEVWIPNKRYKGSMEGQSAGGECKAVPDENGRTSNRSKKVPSFASFDDSVQAAAAAMANSTFIRRAASKVQTKTAKKSAQAAAEQSKHGEERSSSCNAKPAGKRVSFGTSSAIGDTGLKFATEEVFKPHISPCQGVIKTRSAAAKAKVIQSSALRLAHS